MSDAPLLVEAEEKERSADALIADSLRLDALCEQRQETIEKLHAALQATTTAPQPLPLAPLLWSTLAGLAALTSVFLTYLLAMLLRIGHRMDSDAPTAVLAQGVCLIVGGVALLLSRRPGAGGWAKALSQPLAFVLLVLSLVSSGLLILLSVLLI